jgi:hypothetical protein
MALVYMRDTLCGVVRKLNTQHPRDKFLLKRMAKTYLWVEGESKNSLVKGGLKWERIAAPPAKMTAAEKKAYYVTEVKTLDFEDEEE